MMVLLTSTTVVRVKDEDEASALALDMTKAMDDGLARMPQEEISHLGVLVQVVPESFSS
jgi:hypothetical protein